MVYVVGIIGFIGGFCAGQLALMVLLRHKSREALIKDRSLRIYGLLNWLVAALGSAAMVWLYNQYFTS